VKASFAASDAVKEAFTFSGSSGAPSRGDRQFAARGDPGGGVVHRTPSCPQIAKSVVVPGGLTLAALSRYSL
jgi:hypothetical protein